MLGDLGGVVLVGRDAGRRVADAGEPARCRVASRPARTSQTNALDSWIDVFGSPRERDQVVRRVAR